MKWESWIIVISLIFIGLLTFNATFYALTENDAAWYGAMITGLIGIVTIVIMGLIAKKERADKEQDKDMEQLAILNGLKVTLDLIKSNASGQENQLKTSILQKRLVIPTWFIAAIDANHLMSAIAYTFRGRQTQKLKEAILNCNDKIQNMNNIMNWIFEAWIVSNSNALLLVGELINNSYYRDLDRKICDVEKELIRLNP